MPANRDVDHLIESITRKLTAEKQIVARSLAHGRLSWRWTTDGKVDVKIQPEI
jgi:hypothetical protein